MIPSVIQCVESRERINFLFFPVNLYWSYTWGFRITRHEGHTPPDQKTIFIYDKLKESFSDMDCSGNALCLFKKFVYATTLSETVLKLYGMSSNKNEIWRDASEPYPV